MAAKRCNPCNVRNPIGDHTARLQWGQQLRVILENPSVFRLPEGSLWHVQCDGRYLQSIRLSVLERGGDEWGEYIFGFHKVSPRWAERSTLFLGNVHIFVCCPGKKQRLHASVCVFLNCINKEKENVITVVEPTDVCTGVPPAVKLEPSQLLEVVVADADNNPLEWRNYIFPSADATTAVRLNSIRTVTLGLRDPGGNDVNNLFHCERRILPYGDGRMPLFAEHHFFFGFHNITQDTIKGLGNGNYDVGHTVLMGKNQEGQMVREASLRTVFTLRTKTRKREMSRLKPNRCFISDPLERVEALADRTLINPKASERITLYGEEDRFLVEIAQPSSYFPQVSKLTEARWQCEVRSVLLNNRKRHKCIRTQELTPRTIDGIVFQRFGITSADVVGLYEEMMLGEVALTCYPIEKLAVRHERRLHILIRKESLSARITSGFKTVYHNGEPYNISGSASGHASAFCPVHAPRGKGGKRGKRKHRVPQHWEIGIKDVGTDLLQGERVEPTVPIITTSAFANPPLLPIIPYSGEWSPDDIQKWNILDAQWYHDKKAKKKASEAIASLINRRAIRSSVRSVTGNAGTTLIKRKGKRTDTTMFSGNKPPLIISEPKDGDEITLQTGQRLILRMLLPKGNYKRDNLRYQWCVNSTQVEDSLRIWIHSNRIVETEHGVRQECEVLIPTPKGCSNTLPYKGASYPRPGIYRVGALRFDGGDDQVKRIDLNLEVTDKSNRGDVPLNWWLDYFSVHAASRPPDFHLPYVAPHSYVEGRITLVNPKGRSDLELHPGDEVEIILNEPFSLDDKGKPWAAHGAALGGGEIECLDSASHTLPNGEKIYRALFQVNITEDVFWGEIKLYLGGELQKPHIVLIKWKAENDHSEHIVAPRKEESTFGQLVRVEAYDDTDNRKILLRDWHDGQHAVIFPTDHVHIQVPRVRDYLDKSLKHSQKESAWKVEFIPYFLEDSILEHLDLGFDIDPHEPWQPGFLLPSDKPWDAQIYVLPKLDDGQSYIYEIIEAMREVYGTQAYYPFAELVFSYQVDNQFTIQQSLQLDLGNLEFAYDIEPSKPIVVENPADKGLISVVEGRLLRLVLPQKWEKNQTGQDVRYCWRLREHPSWLKSLGCEVKNGRETFDFISELPKKRHAQIGGYLQFELGDKKRKKRIRVVCEEAITQ